MVKRKEITAWVLRQGVQRIGPDLAARVAGEFPQVSQRTMRAALIECGLPMDPLVEGVRQDSLDHLARTLLRLGVVYEDGGPALRKTVRALVITARQHAELAARKKPKAEEILWIRTWLENPPLFAEWLELRLRAKQGS
ncbi:MAG: hypothetical protein HY821_24205 [Acidobacteria bacterium]|nr:hypothetical protein [Acidobacteriota bacterium]